MINKVVYDTNIPVIPKRKLQFNSTQVYYNLVVGRPNSTIINEPMWVSEWVCDFYPWASNGGRERNEHKGTKVA